MHKELRALKKRQTGPNREIFGTEDKAAPMLRRLMETTAMSPDTRAKLMEVKKERMLKRDHERMEAVAKEHANKGSDEFLKKLME